jgi:hypothetical protein
MTCDCKSLESHELEIGHGGNLVKLDFDIESICKTIQVGDGKQACQVTYTFTNKGTSNADIHKFKHGATEDPFAPPIAPGGTDTITDTKPNGNCKKEHVFAIVFQRGVNGKEHTKGDLELCNLT